MMDKINKKDSHGNLAKLQGNEYRETIQSQDLIMLTDMYSIPQLLSLLVRSELHEQEIEY